MVRLSAIIILLFLLISGSAFAQITVTPTVGANGGIFPATAVTADQGASVSFTIRPDIGYYVTTPVAGTCTGSYTGDPYDAINGIIYTTNPVTTNCTVSASFSPYTSDSKNNLTISSAATTNGSWTSPRSDLWIWTPSGSNANLSVTELQSHLLTGNKVIISTNFSGPQTGVITINNDLSWNTGALSLYADGDVAINAELSASGASTLAMGSTHGAIKTGQTGSSTGRVNFDRSGKDILFINGVNYTLINSLGSAGSVTGLDLQGINGNLSAAYALGNDINAAPTLTWNPDPDSPGAYFGFQPLGSLSAPFTGVFDGLGHTISNLAVTRYYSLNYVGLFGNTNGATLKDIGLNNVSISGYTRVGGLVGQTSGGSISNAYTSGRVNGDTYIGGLVGSNVGTAINNAYSTSSAKGSYAGGLVGINGGALTNVFASGDVGGVNKAYIGGLVGENNDNITNAYTSGAVTGNADSTGGVAGWNSGAINNAFWDTQTTGQSVLAGNDASTTGGNTTAAMTQLATFNLVWDFGAVWSITNNVSYPYLATLPMPAATTGMTGSVVIDSGADVTTSSLVPLLLSCSDRSNCTNMMISNDLLTWSGVLPFSTSQNWTLSAGDGIKTVYVKFRNSQGVWSDIFSDTISLLAVPILTVSITGTGNGTVTSVPAGISCPSGSCSKTFTDPVTLHATPSAYSQFSGWSGGGCAGTTDCSLSMSANTDVTATFTAVPLLRIGTTPYATLQEAYDAAPDTAAVIQMIADNNVGTLTAGRAIQVTLQGGYDLNYTPASGTTVITSPVIVGTGQVVVEKIIIN